MAHPMNVKHPPSMANQGKEHTLAPIDPSFSKMELLASTDEYSDFLCQKLILHP